MDSSHNSSPGRVSDEIKTMSHNLRARPTIHWATSHVLHTTQLSVYLPAVHPKTDTCMHGNSWNVIGWKRTYRTGLLEFRLLKTTFVGSVLPMKS